MDQAMAKQTRVETIGVTSEWMPVTRGVPSGSVMRPFLYLIYINDVDRGLNNFICKFADDTKIGNAVLSNVTG